MLGPEGHRIRLEGSRTSHSGNATGLPVLGLSRHLCVKVVWRAAVLAGGLLKGWHELLNVAHGSTGRHCVGWIAAVRLKVALKTPLDWPASAGTG